MNAGSKDHPESADAVLAPMSAVDTSDSALIEMPYAPPPPQAEGLFKKLASRGAWAMGDQAVVSIGNYITLLVIARNLPTANQLGAFSIILNVLLFLNSLQSALIIYPLLVRGAPLDKPAMQRLATGCLIAALLLCIPLSLAMLGTSVYFAGMSLFLWAPLALIFLQLQELARRVLLAHLRFAAAIPGDAISYLMQAGILLLLRHHLTLPLTFAVMALTSALAAVVQALQIGPRRFPLSEFEALVADFWTLSRWVLYSNLGSFVTSNSYDMVLYFRWGAVPVGYFAAMAFVAKLVNPLTTALGSLIIPSVARARAGGGTHFAMRVGLKYALFGLFALGIYFGLLGLFPTTCLRIYFGKAHPDYVQKLPGLLRVLVCSWTLLFITNMAVAILNGLGYSRVNFLATMANGIVSVLISLPLIYMFGLLGTIIGGFLATGAATIVAVYCFIRHHNDALPPPSELSPAPAAT
jgi:O-antigen/teichoic acid export membrane protein